VRVAIVVFILFFHAMSAGANDSAIDVVGGTFQPLKGEHKSIRMLREHVRMTILPDYRYRVTVDFVFHNDGPATRVLMGFPETGYGADMEPSHYKRGSGFRRFATWVDGHRVKARYVFHGGHYEAYEAHWVKRVRFARGQTRRIRVRYSTEWGGDSTGGFFADYNFTGGNWRGEVEESLVTVTFLVPGTHSVRGRFSERDDRNRVRVSEHRRGNRFFYRFRHWEAEGDFSLYFKPALRNPLAVNFGPPCPREFEGTTLLTYGDRSRIYCANQPAKAALYSGMAVMALRELEEWFNTKLDPEQKDRLMPNRKWRSRHFDNSIYPPLAPFCYAHWRERDRTVWLRVGVHVFGFRAGKDRIVVNGTVHRLPAPPLLVLDRGQFVLYAPLRPITQALGGRVSVIREEQRVWFHL
jgi:hypothetical protein